MQIDRSDIAAEIWRTVLDYIPARDREPAAEQLILSLRGLDFSESDIESLAEHDQYIHAVLEVEAEEEEYYEDEDDDGYDEDDSF
jgi:hypothetical protein